MFLNILHPCSEGFKGKALTKKKKTPKVLLRQVTLCKLQNCHVFRTVMYRITDCIIRWFSLIDLLQRKVRRLFTVLLSLSFHINRPVMRLLGISFVIRLLHQINLQTRFLCTRVDSEHHLAWPVRLKKTKEQISLILVWILGLQMVCVVCQHILVWHSLFCILLIAMAEILEWMAI